MAPSLGDTPPHEPEQSTGPQAEAPPQLPRGMTVPEPRQGSPRAGSPGPGYDRRDGPGSHSHHGGDFGGRYGGGGFGGGGHTHTWKPGDWTCMACHSHCFASRDTCFRCGADRLGQRGPPPGPRFDPRYPQDPGMYPPFDPGMAGMPGAAFPPPGAESVYVHVPPPSIPGGYGDAAAWGRGPIKDGGYPMRYEAFEYQPHDTCYRVPGAPEAAPAAGGMSGGAPGFGGGAPGASGSKPFRHGDWNCAKCQAHNFASRVVCFRCGAEKVE
ncbi:hypothetical protein ACKKBF_B36280 [Auxenochlorella protothecoides x Auxenochlorella symbiontica]|uniref:RanBP2-type domain-containing protein n=2 Tax=Auxenochlorella protothecoides TaxID=3075 RepID=A0A1D2A8C4_AUXPR